MAKKIMIIAGEASGDLHGGRLVAALKAADPAVEVFGVGGDQMAAAGMELKYHIRQLSYIGFTEVAKHFFFFRRVFQDLMWTLRQRRPDVVVLIDYPGFNLRFAREAKKAGARTLYYIAPQVWAWARGRAKKMAQFIDEMAVIFPFEVDFFSRYGIPTHFVGHPLLEGLKTGLSREAFAAKYHFDLQRPLLAILPGSRKQEVTGLLPDLCRAVSLLRQRHPGVQVAVSQAPTIPRGLLEEATRECAEIPFIADTYDLLQHATAGIVASGTATLETALMRLPFLIVYRVSRLSFFLGKQLIKIPFIGLVNVVAGEKIIGEFLQDDVNADKLIPEIERLLFNENARNTIRKNLDRIRAELGQSGASQKTAQQILELAGRK